MICDNANDERDRLSSCPGRKINSPCLKELQVAVQLSAPPLCTLHLNKTTAPADPDVLQSWPPFVLTSLTQVKHIGIVFRE